MRILLLVLALLAMCLTLNAPWAQPLKSKVNDPNDPDSLVVNPYSAAQLQQVLERLRELNARLQASDMDPDRKQAELSKFLRKHEDILVQHYDWVDWQQPQTVDSIAVFLERTLFEIAAEEIAPNDASREQVLRDAPAHLGLEPGQDSATPRYEPPLQAPIDDTDTEAVPAPVEEEALASQSGATADERTDPAPPAPGEGTSVPGDPDKKERVAVMAGDSATREMHNDNTVVRNVTDDSGERLLLGDLHIWAGGAAQLDAYGGDGLFTLADGGSSESETYVRRGEGILRASLFDHNEFKVQYDFDAKLFRDLYWRWLSESTASALTVGNQKEPLGLDYLVGSKFNTAMEPSAPSTAFGNYRSKGVRYSAWGAVDDMLDPLELWGDNRTYLTGSFGLFGEDIENSNDTDWAVTGRGTVGARPTETTGYHLGISMSYRHGEYTRIAPRPDLHDANRIRLAEPDSDTQVVVALEGMGSMGSMQGQAELYYADYSGGNVDAEGWGAYGQVGWMFGGKRRIYQPRWGMWQPVDAAQGHVFEIFGRISVTRGNDDVNSSNELSVLTVGGNWYYRNFRVAANLIYAETGRDLVDEGDGLALGLRLQLLF
jgi:phosphate-selective porin